MRKIIAIGLMTIFLAFSAAAQDTKSERQELTDKFFALYQKGDFDEAVKLGEKLVKMEKNAKDSVSYATAVVNLARLKRAFYESLRGDFERRGGKTAPELRAIFEKSVRIIEESEELFREALAANVTNGREKTAQTADIKRDLAWILSNHTYARKNTVERARSRIDEAEELLLGAVALNEQTRGKDADETLFTVLDAGDFYYKHVNFEKALPFYERFINVVGQKHGANHPALVGALRPVAAILFTTFQDAEASAMVKRIEAITKKSEPALTSEINFYLRSGDAVEAGIPAIKEQNERTQTYRNLRRTQLSSTSALMLGVTTVPVAVEVDEQGKIVSAVAKTDNKKLKAEAESAIVQWIVRPFSYNGTARKMRGTLVYRKV